MTAVDLSPETACPSYRYMATSETGSSFIVDRDYDRRRKPFGARWEKIICQLSGPHTQHEWQKPFHLANWTGR